VRDRLSGLEFVHAGLNVSKKIEFVDEPLILGDSHEHGCAATTLREHEGASRDSHLLDELSSVRPELREGADVFFEMHASHPVYLLLYI
jgi:hypothetical protein